MSDRPPWQRQPQEPARAFAAFRHYRDQGEARSIRSAAKAWLTTGASPKRHREQRRYAAHPRPKAYLEAVARRWREWSRHWNWVQRARAYDDHVGELAASQEIESQLQMRREELDAIERERRTRLGQIRSVRLVSFRLVERLARMLDELDAMDQKAASGLLKPADILVNYGKITTAFSLAVRAEREELRAQMSAQPGEEEHPDALEAEEERVNRLAAKVLAEMERRLRGKDEQM